jgi:uncharacterized protein YabN with tetrapyrrole methylase and pyrophosphatase domain
VFGDVPETLPALLYARKLLRRAEVPPSEASIASVRERLGALESGDPFEAIGDVLFELVALARGLRVDPELALRSAADRFRERVIAESA